MKTIRKEQVGSFLAAAGAIGLAGVLTRACPGGCTSCVTCASALLPMGATAGTVGLAFVGSAGIRARAKVREHDASKRRE